MPPKARLDRQKIVDAAFCVIRESGYEHLNTRSIADKLGCSTQPVLYYFKTLEEIKKEVYMTVDEYHSEYLVRNLSAENSIRSIGMNYIRFGYEEKNLFRFLMQSDGFNGQMQGLFEDERLLPILGILSKQLECDLPKAKKVFSSVFFAVHGIAGLLANNSMEYDEQWLGEIMDVIYHGVIRELN